MEMFKSGDVVQLKSGGPSMTVELSADENYESKGRVRCVWFEGKKMQFGDFLPTMIEIYDAEAGGGILMSHV